MTDQAAHVLPVLGSILRALPEYEAYVDADSAYRQEAPWRLAVGREVKAWGDRLLDVAEGQGPHLGRRDAMVLDHLVATLTDLFRRLSCGGRVEAPPRENGSRERLRASDARILQLLEEGGALLAGLPRGELAAEWLQDEARLFYKGLRGLRREIEDRNRTLGLRPTPAPGPRRPALGLL
jgi:hypothetical protein